ncbi:MAG: PorT family protein [Bryobacterales bacterium]|nr:PorT family protein [Bryobacterales bacterium]
MKQLALLLLVVAAPSQAIDLGVRGGLPFGDAFESLRTANFELKGRNRFVVGPTLEIRLPAGLGVNLDFLYRRYQFQTVTPSGTLTKGAGQFEIPVMLRYHFPGILARPFIAGGPVWSTITGLNSTRNSTGVALGAGIDIHIPFAHVTPELRYTRRFQDTVVTAPSGSLKSLSNQIDLLVGFTF